jgi:hypothetical protein
MTKSSTNIEEVYSNMYEIYHIHTYMSTGGGRKEGCGGLKATPPLKISKRGPSPKNLQKILQLFLPKFLGKLQNFFQYF